MEAVTKQQKISEEKETKTEVTELEEVESV